MTPRRRPRALVQAERFDDRALDALRHLNATLAPYGVAPEWPLLVMNYESAGLDHLCVNSHGFSGLFQMSPKVGTPYVDLPGKSDPATQIKDAEDFWLSMTKAFKIPKFDSLGHFYCLNLAPAKVTSRVVYAGPGPYLEGDGLEEELAKEYKARPHAYAAQDPALDPGKKGWLRAADFGDVILANRTARVGVEISRL